VWVREEVFFYMPRTHTGYRIYGRQQTEPEHPLISSFRPLNLSLTDTSFGSTHGKTAKYMAGCVCSGLEQGKARRQYRQPRKYGGSW
jgi:hypothetical protein